MMEERKELSRESYKTMNGKEAADRCLSLLQHLADDVGELLQSYTQLALLAGGMEGNEIEEFDNEDRALDREWSTGAIVIFANGNVLEYPLRSLKNFEIPDDEIIEVLGDTGLLFSYCEDDLVITDDQDYLAGAMLVFRTDEEGEVLPLSDEDLLTARREAMKMLRIVKTDTEDGYMFELSREDYD
jgi:hypothetical protein